MFNNHLHTFCVLAYKESPFIEKCLLSLLNQSIKSEILICTSTPSHFLANLAEKYSVKLIINENPPGIGSDWNFAFKQAKTKYVTLAHQDDTYDSKYTKLCVEAGEKIKDCQFVFTDYSEIINDIVTGTRLMLYIKRLLLWPFKFSIIIRNKFFKRLSVSFGNPISCPSVMYNKSVLEDFRFIETMKTNLDWIAWIQLSKTNGAWICVPHRLTNHRIHRESETSNTINNNARMLEDLYIFEQIWGKIFAKILMKFYRLSYKSNFENI